jgi:dehydrogenase/reductase SDR family protein 12
MPDFHRKMQDKLRTPEEGADTMIWLAIAKDALNKPSGMFFQGKSI